jgi:hypothetical protein
MGIRFVGVRSNSSPLSSCRMPVGPRITGRIHPWVRVSKSPSSEPPHPVHLWITPITVQDARNVPRSAVPARRTYKYPHVTVTSFGSASYPAVPDRVSTRPAGPARRQPTVAVPPMALRTSPTRTDAARAKPPVHLTAAVLDGRGSTVCRRRLDTLALW